MNCFDVTRILNSQGADESHLAAVLEVLHSKPVSILPKWHEGYTGAELSPREVVSIILGATATNPREATAHVDNVATLERDDGYIFANVLTKIMQSIPGNIQVDELTINSDVATIRYTNGNIDTFSKGTPKAFRQATVISGCLLQAIAIQMQQSTTSGWSGWSVPREEED